MKILKIISIGLLAIFTLGFTFLSFYDGPSIKLNTAGQFEYAPLQNIELHQFEKMKQYIGLQDGTQIAANFFLPKTTETKVPTIFIFTPYNRSIMVPEMKWWEKAGAKALTGTWGPVFSALPNRKTLNILTSQGYAVVVADMRGSGASSGHTSVMSPQLRKDGIEIINWIAEQDWSNGKVGMLGPSYLGWIQLAIASEKPEALKCISPSIMGSDIYMEAQKQGGIQMTKWIGNFNRQLRLINLNGWDANGIMPVFPAEPVLDEDGDGDFLDEIPIHGSDTELSFVGNDQPSYKDGSERKENRYFNYTREHLENIWTLEVANKWKYRDDTIVVYNDTMTIEDITPAFMVPKIRESKIPILMSGGWFDGFEGITKLYASLQNTNPVHIVMSHRFHIPMTMTDPYKELFNYKGDVEDQYLSLQIQFFDRYLKEKNNDFTKIKPVQLYTAFKGWDSFDSYPPKTETQTFFLNNDSKLNINNSVEGQDTYEVDFSHSAGYDKEGDNRWNMATATNSLMLRTELDKKCLVYETEVLENDLQVTGHPIVELFLSSNQKDADVYVYLSDVGEDGTVYYVGEGELRAGWHREVPDDEQVNNLYDIKPDLPWHGFDKGGYDHAPLANDSIISMRFDITPTSWLFQKGHKLRISIAGADYENFELNPTLCPDNKLDNCKPTNLNIHRGLAFPSRIELPIIK